MTMSEVQRIAQDKMNEAVEQIIAAYDTFNEGEIEVGWTLVVCGVRFASRELDNDLSDDFDDEQEMVSRYSHYVKRGQQPVITRGMMESCMDRYRS